MSLKEQLMDAIVDGDNMKVSNLVDGMDVSAVNERSEKRGMTALHAACKRKNDAALNILLAKSGIDVNAQDTRGGTPLHFMVCKIGKDEAISKLLAVPGIDINVEDKEGYTPLHLACLTENSQAVALLLATPGIQVNVKGESGHTPLHMACQTNNDQVVSRLLATPDIDVNVKDFNGVPPVMIAAGFHNEETFKLMLQDYRVDLEFETNRKGFLEDFSDSSEENRKYADRIRAEVMKRNYTRICWSCSKTKMEVELYKCAGCGTAKYCGRECIERDWPVHKNWCLKQQEKRQNLAVHNIE